MKTYTENVWQIYVSSQYQLEGYLSHPDVSCEKLKIPTSVPREIETLFMSVFYQNNLMNTFLYKHNKYKFDTPKCSCNMDEDQDALHILTACRNIDKTKHQNMIQTLNELDTCSNTEDHIMLLNCSRNPEFIKRCLAIMAEGAKFLRTEIEL